MAESRYRSTGIIDRNYYESVDFPRKEELETINTFRIRIAQFERLDNLAFKHLGSGEYWWVIALINGLEWPYAFEPGQIIKIPVEVDDVLRLF
jgi:hypothetical protein